MDLNLMKRVLSLLLALVLLIGNVPAVAFATEEIAEETVAETSAPTEAVTEPVMETSASTAVTEPVKETAAPTAAATKPVTEPVQETVAPTEAATEPVVEETTAPTLPAVPEETVAPTEPAEGEAITGPVKTEFQFTVSDMDLPTNEELHTAYAEHVLYGTQIATFGTAAGERLTGDEKLLYDAMVPLIKQIASGERASTVIGVGQTVTSGGVTYEPDSEVTFTGAPLDQEAMTRVFDALLSDLPYEMYWFDKTAAGEGFAFTMDGVFVYGQQSLPVAGNYRGADTYTVDTAKTGAAAAAAGNAENIVAKYAASSDYEKLVGYRDEICALVSYNFDALNMDFNEDNDPWQLIYVFDEDESTNVVCEGYSKAFMYLCDKTNFAGDVSCHTVSGQMNGGNHMWNVVTIEGSNYLVDVTNSDGGMAGQNGGLFLAGGTGNASSTYNVMNIYYAYNIRTKNFWGTGADSILTLASENYTPQTGGGEDEDTIVSGDWGSNITWVFDRSTGTLTLSGEGEMDSTLVRDTPWRNNFDQDIINLVIGEGITNIGGSTFNSCVNLQNVQIPNSVTSIDWGAFGNCDSLTEISIPFGVTTIAGSAFEDCDGLIAITIPASVTTIGEHAFFRCIGLQSITFEGDAPVFETEEDGSIYTFGVVTATAYYPANNPTWNADVMQNYGGTITWTPVGGAGEIIIANGTCGENVTWMLDDEGVLTISGTGDMAIDVVPWRDYREFITAVVIQEGVTSIDDDAFYRCSGLTSIEIPDSVTEIGDYAFDWCSNLKHVTIGSGITAIGEGVFSLCYNLTSIRIPDSVTSIDVNAFRNSATPTDIYYGGSQAQWSAVTNRPVAEYVHYSCEDLSRHWRTVTVDPTYTAGGYSYEYCSCGYERNNVITGNALGLPKPVVQAISDSVTGGATLRWEHDGEADRYEVYRATSKSGKYTRLVSVPSSTVMVSVSPGKTYYYKVKAICDANSKLSSGYSNVVKVTGRCAQPEITAAVHASSGKPMITWGKIGGAKKYEVYRATEENGTYTKVKTTTSTTYTDTSATVGTTYFYKVKAIASKSAHNSIDSAAKSCRTLCAQPAVTLKINADIGKPTISWKAISGAAQYEILRAESADGEFTKLAVQSTVTYTDLSAAPDKDYWYKVNALGATAELNSADGTAKKIHATLAKPMVTFAVDEVSGKPVLTWEAVEGAVQYKIYRSTSAKKSYKAIATVTDTEYVATSASVGKGYYYKVIAIGETAESAYSSYKKLTAKCAQPGITVEASATSGKPVIKWSKVSGAKKYYVYRVDENGVRTSIGSTTKTTFTDSKAVLGTTYTYQVRANGSKSAYNSIFSAVESCLTILGKPVVTAKNDAATGKVILSWKAIPGATAYEVYRTGDDGILCRMYTQSALTYTDEGEGTDVDTVYTYKVRAITGEPALDSADSNEVTTSAVCARPVASIALNGKKPMVTWESVEGATKYYVYRSTKKSSGYKKVATVEEDTYTDTKAKKGTTYYYKVVAVGENATSAQSAYVKIKSK